MVTSILKIIGSGLEIAGNWIKTKSDPNTRRGNLEIDVIKDWQKAINIAETYIRKNHDFITELRKYLEYLDKKERKIVLDFIEELYKLEHEFFENN